MKWHKKPTIKELNNFCKNTLVEHLNITITEVSDDYIVATMPITDEVKQPYGLMHGGASCVLAESIASIASNLCLDPSKSQAVGSSIETKHIRPIRSGIIIGKTYPIHIGRRMHIWEIKITDQVDNLISTTLLTTAIIRKK
jgi:1,4-dihydroxy-2-naphthoyl-CoA hydrolase